MSLLPKLSGFYWVRKTTWPSDMWDVVRFLRPDDPNIQYTVFKIGSELPEDAPEGFVWGPRIQSPFESFPHVLLAKEGFHRIGRIDDVGRRSLWLREEVHAFELRAGREGDDAHVRVSHEHPLFSELYTVMNAARFASEYESPNGNGLDTSYALDECAASINRPRNRFGGRANDNQNAELEKSK